MRQGEMAQNTRTLVERQPGLLVDPQVRAGLTAGGKWIRTIDPASGKVVDDQVLAIRPGSVEH